MSLWRIRNITRELFHEIVRRLRLNGIDVERIVAEVESVYAEDLDKADMETYRGAKIPKGWL